MARDHPAYFFLFVVIVAPIGAAVVVAALLLFGVPPRLVFAPGHAVLSLFSRGGIHAPRAVGVLTTVGSYWLLIVGAGVLLDRARRSRRN